ncbi:hypothetical protein SCG7086_AC_00020 [Chlamydiales bacterium SCGC AG-110-P3]|nr:hypothetical protein SCG7086_AC_00020 [Chlamydiales bacterium SCGC AG-110-P3]
MTLLCEGRRIIFRVLKACFRFFISQLTDVPWDQLAVLDIRTNSLIQNHQDFMLEEEKMH